jgi:hypothetical protein
MNKDARGTILERLMAKIDQSDGCWVWTGARSVQGYGRIWNDGTTRLAHRVLYELGVGPIPAGLDLDHVCRNTTCVNPSHLEPVTHAENMRRIRKSHCANGHKWCEATTYIRPSRNERECRACNRERQAARNARRREAA